LAYLFIYSILGEILHKKKPSEFCVFVRACFVGLAYQGNQGKDIVLRFIIEYSSLRDFYRPLGNNNNNNNNNRSIFIRGFFEDYIFAQ
jgi:hypothetical protein